MFLVGPERAAWGKLGRLWLAKAAASAASPATSYCHQLGPRATASCACFAFAPARLRLARGGARVGPAPLTLLSRAEAGLDEHRSH